MVFSSLGVIKPTMNCAKTFWFIILKSTEVGLNRLRNFDIFTWEGRLSQIALSALSSVALLSVVCSKPPISFFFSSSLEMERS